MVRSESIMKLESMDAKKHEEIATRIINNHEVTEARVAHTIKKANKKHTEAMETLESAQ